MHQLCSPSRQHPRPPRLHRIRTLAAATGRQTCPAPVTSETASVVHKKRCGECPWHLSGDDIHPSGCGLESSAQCPVPSAGTPKYGGRPWTPCHGRDTLRLFETTSRSSESAIETSAMTADRSANCTLLRIRALEKVARGGPHCSPDHARHGVCSVAHVRCRWRGPTERPEGSDGAHHHHTQRVGRSPRGAIVHAIAQSTPPQRRRSWRAHLDHRPPIFELAVLVHLNRLKSIWRLR